MLVETEDQGVGRVRLDKSYESALTNQTWQFLESVPYPRQLGALDEAESQQSMSNATNLFNIIDGTGRVNVPAVTSRIDQLHGCAKNIDSVRLMHSSQAAGPATSIIGDEKAEASRGGTSDVSKGSCMASMPKMLIMNTLFPVFNSQFDFENLFV